MRFRKESRSLVFTIEEERASLEVTFFGCFRNSPVVGGPEEEVRPPPVPGRFGYFRLLPAERAERRRWWRPCWEQQVRQRLPVCRARSSAAEGRGGARQAAGCGGRE